jgi:hypothetical protein
MKTEVRETLKKLGGVAALLHASILIVGLILSFTVMFSLIDAAPEQAAKFLAENLSLAFHWKLIINWGAAITLAIMLLSLYPRLKQGSSFLMLAAMFFAFLWAVLTIGTGDLMLHSFGVVANLTGNAPAQAAAWTALARSLWVLLLSIAALRMGGIAKVPSYVGMFLGITGSLTMIPTLAEVMFMIFGPGMMVWFVWVGIDLLRKESCLAVQMIAAEQ